MSVEKEIDDAQLEFLRSDVLFPDIKPYHIMLEDGQTDATVYPLNSADQVPIGLLTFLCEEFNMEIDRGDTYPLYDQLELETFRHYWFDSFAAIMLIGDSPTLGEDVDWEQRFLGTFYVKPNYPGRCSHVCNAGFLVNAAIRGKGIGKTLGKIYLRWAPKLGYTYSVFNLVFETNTASVKIWDSLGFSRIGRIKGAGNLKGHLKPVDAIMFGRVLIDEDEDQDQGQANGHGNVL